MPNWLLFIFDVVSICLLSFAALSSVGTMIAGENKEKRASAFMLLLCVILIMTTLILNFN